MGAWLVDGSKVALAITGEVLLAVLLGFYPRLLWAKVALAASLEERPERWALGSFRKCDDGQQHEGDFHNDSHFEVRLSSVTCAEGAGRLYTSFFLSNQHSTTQFSRSAFSTLVLSSLVSARDHKSCRCAYIHENLTCRLRSGFCACISALVWNVIELHMFMFQPDLNYSVT